MPDPTPTAVPYVPPDAAPAAVPTPARPVPTRIDPDRETRPRSSAEIRQLLDARTADLKFRIEALKQDVTTPAAYSLGGQPLPEALRANTLRYAGIAAATGIVLGLLVGMRAHRKARRNAPDEVQALLQARLATFFDDAAARVRPGLVSGEEALRETLRRTPIVPLPPQSNGSAAADQAQSSIRQAVDLAVKTATGFAVKAAMDAVTSRVTGYASTGEAIAAATED